MLPLSAPPRESVKNIDTILMLEKREEEKLAPHHRVFHAIGSFVGTVQFIVLQCIAVVCWIAVNGFFPDHALDSSPFLAEREATRSLRILRKIAGRLGINDEDCRDDELANETSVDQIAQDLQERENAEEA